MQNDPPVIFRVGIIVLVVFGVYQYLYGNLADLVPEISPGGISLPEISTDKLSVNPLVTSDKCSVSHKFPENITKWCALITKYAEKNSLPPDLIAALIWQESGGNQKAYSKAGAVGLMQVMPRDGIAAGFMCVNGPCFSKRPSMSELYDPEFNVKYGTKMLAGLVSRYGNYRDALKYYGPSGVGYYYADKVLSIYKRYK